MQMAGFRTSSIKMVVQDLFIFELNPDFSLSNVKIIDKSKTSIELPAGYGLISHQQLAAFIKLVDGFDYSFTQLHKDKMNFSVCYTDYEKAEKKREWKFYAVTKIDNQYSTDKLSLKTDATTLKVLPAKAGNVLLIEYFRKLKKLNMRLEKINY